jgi:hypothetical protein
MTKVQKAFSYLLDLLGNVYGTGWIPSEALEDAVIEFSLDEDEARQLRWLHEAFESFALDFSVPSAY